MTAFTGQIRLYPSRGTWMIDLSSTAQADEIADLFGSHTIPTAFTTRCDAATVVKEIATRYPHARIVVAC